MLSWALQITIISIILIFLVHNLIQFFRDTLTIPKVKDLVNAPSQKYENMFLAMNNSREDKKINSTFDENYKQSLLPTKVREIDVDVGNMKNELKQYLKTQNILGSNLETNKQKVKITDLL
jgi:hypothetical protein